MDNAKLLATLHDEMVLLKAKSAGAEKAYEQEAVRQFQEEVNSKLKGRVINIKYRDGFRKAEMERTPEYSKWDFSGYQGPAFYGYLALASGKKSKTRSALFTRDMFIAGRVTPHTV